MPRRFLWWFSILSLIGILALPQAIQGQMGRPLGMMGHHGMGQGGDVQTIHQLFADHDQIHRTVEQISGGIRAVTESDNPEFAALIQAHVSQMYDRITTKQLIPMIGMSSTLPIMVQVQNQYERQLRMTSKGIEVTETSNDSEIVTIIRKHAQEVTKFAEQGMSAMMDGRMR